MRNILIFFIGIFFLSCAFAQDKPAPEKPTPEKRFRDISCPPVSALKKDPKKLNWSAEGGWKSYELSFVNHIAGFMGAQWHGVKIGQITCVYQGQALHAFPILLVFNTIAVEPDGGEWSKNLGGYKNCVSSSQSECNFLVPLKPKQGNIYQELEQFKQKHPNVEK